MPGPTSPAALAALTTSVAVSRVDTAVDRALESLAAGTPASEVLRAAARGAADRYEVGAGAPHGLLALASAANARDSMDPQTLRLASVQAVALAAAERKQSEPLRPPAVVSGEVTHLARSALLAARRGDLPEAESLFLGIVDEGWERAMAGDILFRAALEDRTDGGHKLIVAVGLWALCRATEFRDARTILRPAVRYLVNGDRDAKGYETMMAVLGREWVDLDGLELASRPMDEAAAGKLATVVAASSDEACVAGILALLREGVSPVDLAGGVVTEAARRVLASEGPALDAVHALLYVHAARTVLTFSRTSERMYALFQGALRVRSPAPHPLSFTALDAPGEEAGLAALAEDIAARRPREAAARVHAYLGRGFSARRLVECLGRATSAVSALADQGHALSLADACASEFAATNAPELPMALAKVLAASPRDADTAAAWAARLGP